MENLIDRNRDLYRLIYCSRATLPAKTTIETELPRILARSARRNAQDGITGALLAYDGWFLQALEGPPVKVADTYARLSRDPRHQSLRLIHVEAISQRSFTSWSMCGQQLSVRDDAILAILESRPKFGPERLTPATALKLLEAITRMRGTYSMTGAMR